MAATVTAFPSAFSSASASASASALLLLLLLPLLKTTPYRNARLDLSQEGVELRRRPAVLILLRDSVCESVKWVGEAG